MAYKRYLNPKLARILINIRHAANIFICLISAVCLAILFALYFLFLVEL